MNTPDHDTLFRAVVDANPEANARLKEIMDQYPDPEDELIEIWETWIERMDPQHPVYMEPLLLAGYKAFFDKAYAELMKERATSG
jgi:hypothetical protein